MAEIDAKILAKIKKCLALASSSNPNEAATALRQARSLMDKHGVTSETIVMADIGESSVPSRTMARDKPARWEVGLAAMVGDAFGCKMMVARTLAQRGRVHINDGSYVFVGLKQQAEVAAYTASVLIRRCKSARQKWIADQFKGLSTNGVPGLKRRITRMGDAFAEGWVHSIAKLVTDFANPPEIDAAIERHIKAQSSGDEAPMRSMSKKDVGDLERIAARAGMHAAQGEALYRPMAGQEAPAALESR